MTLDQLSNLVKDPKLFGILIVRPFGLLLQWLYSIVQNYGIAVILFALLVKLVCIPLTIKSKKSMLAMSAMNAAAASEEVREQPRQAERRDAEAV